MLLRYGTEYDLRLRRRILSQLTAAEPRNINGDSTEKRSFSANRAAEPVKKHVYITANTAASSMPMLTFTPLLARGLLQNPCDLRDLRGKKSSTH